MSEFLLLAEGAGFEPARPVTRPASFQDWYHQPLGHPSRGNIIYRTAKLYHEERLANRERISVII